jgi:hypothetical protein
VEVEVEVEVRPVMVRSAALVPAAPRRSSSEVLDRLFEAANPVRHSSTSPPRIQVTPTAPLVDTLDTEEELDTQVQELETLVDVSQAENFVVSTLDVLPTTELAPAPRAIHMTIPAARVSGACQADHSRAPLSSRPVNVVSAGGAGRGGTGSRPPWDSQ